MPPSEDEREFWRGTVTTKLDQVIAGIEGLTHRFSTHEVHDNQRFEKINDDMSSVKTRVAWWSGAAAAIGTAIGWAISWAVDKPK